MHVIPGLHMGGAESMLASLVSAKRSRPISQVVVNILAGGALAKPIRESGISIRELGARNILAFPLAVARLALLIRKLKPAAIQSWLYYGDLTALLALWISGRRRFTRLYWGIRCSTMDQTQYRATLKWTIAACARLSRSPDAVIANSFAGREAHQKLGYSPRVFAVIPNGINSNRFHPDSAARARIRDELNLPPDTRMVIHVARVDPMKDHATLIEAMTRLPQYTFLLAGLGTDALSLPRNGIGLGVRSDTPALFAASDIALSTSAFGEGFPNVLAEAMACGVPAVATDVGDSKRILGETGIVVAPHDVNAIVEAIRRLLDEPAAARQQICRDRIVTLFSLDKAVAEFDALHLDAKTPNAAQT